MALRKRTLKPVQKKVLVRPFESAQGRATIVRSLLLDRRTEAPTPQRSSASP